MRSALLTVSVVLLGCGLGPPPEVHPARGQACNELRHAIVGTWVRDGSAMELRADGSLLRDSIEGAYRFTRPSEVTIDVPGSHEEHTVGLSTASVLLDVDATGVHRVWSRISGVPTFPEGCFELHGSLVGHWTDGMTTESFHADGSYERGAARGNWSMPETGMLDVAVGLHVRRYRVAMAPGDVLVTALEGETQPDDTRPPSFVAVRAP